MLNKILPNRLIILSSILLGLASPLWGQGYLVWIAFIPIIYFINNETSYKNILIQSFWMQLFFSIIIFFWIPESFQKLWPDSSLWVNTGIFLFLMSIVELQIIAWALLRKKISKHISNFLIIALVSAGIYTLFDMITLKFVKDTLSHALFKHYAIKQWVYYIGTYGLTFFIFMVNELLSYSFKFKKHYWIGVSSLVLAYSSGYYFLNNEKNHKEGKKIKIVSIQPNFLHEESLKNQNNAEFKINKTNKIISMIIDAKKRYPNADYIVLPETIYPISYFTPSNFEEESLNLKLKQVVKDLNIELFFGGIKKEGVYNANAYIHLFLKDNEIQENYSIKRKLFPFGEEIPFSDLFPGLRNFFPIPAISAKGNKISVGQLANGIKFGTAICYETITPEIADELAKQNAQFILNPTNEASFTSFGEPQLALALTSFRALENDIPIIRTAATGVSAFIDNKGRIIDETNMDEESFKYYEMELFSKNNKID